jgi:hypothetical protein
MNKNPEKLREKAAEYLEKAEYYSNLSAHASDYAPGAYITGGSGRSKGQNKKTEQALNRTIELAKKAVYFREKAASLEIRAKYYENESVRLDQKQKNKERDKQEKKKIKNLDPKEALFCGAYSTGIFYADKRKEINGDYMTIGRIYYSDLNWKINDNCSADIRSFVQADIDKILSMKGQEYQVSSCGQTVILGENCK